MSRKANCVFDTNCLISAPLIKSSISRKAFDQALDYYEILISDETAAEFEDVAGRKKFEKYLEEGEREIFEELLYRESKFIEVTVAAEASGDPDDNKFLELAICGKADIIISGDKDLLALDPFRNIRVVTHGHLLKSLHFQKSDCTNGKSFIILVIAISN